MARNSLDWWRDRYASDTAHWHMGQYHPNLIKYLPILTGNKPPLEAGLMLIPLCGKSLDMKFLYAEGFRVVGVDCSEKAIQDFFTENNLKYESKFDDRIGTVYSTPDGRLRIICGDMFKLTREIIGGLAKMVWDRGALVAVDKETRKEYASVMSSLVAPGARYLVDTLHYSDWYYSGPPRNVPPKLIDCLFEERFEIKLLERIDVSQRLQKLGVSPVFEHVHLMTARGALSS